MSFGWPDEIITHGGWIKKRNFGGEKPGVEKGIWTQKNPAILTGLFCNGKSFQMIRLLISIPYVGSPVFVRKIDSIPQTLSEFEAQDTLTLW